MDILSNWAFSWSEVQHKLPEGNGLCLDLGCGDGRHRAWLEAAGWTWIGLDVDATRGGALIQGDAFHLPFANEIFNLVVLWQVLEHVEQPWTALLEVNRILNPGGLVVGSVSCLEPFHDVCSYFGFTHKGVEQILTDSGFTDIQIQAGLNAFSLIARNWLKGLLGSFWGERVAFLWVRVSFVLFLWAYLGCDGGGTCYGEER